MLCLYFTQSLSLRQTTESKSRRYGRGINRLEGGSVTQRHDHRNLFTLRVTADEKTFSDLIKVSLGPFVHLFPFCLPDLIVTVYKGNSWMETEKDGDEEEEGGSGAVYISCSLTVWTRERTSCTVWPSFSKRPPPVLLLALGASLSSPRSLSKQRFFPSHTFPQHVPVTTCP